MGDGGGMHVGKRLKELINDVLARAGIGQNALLHGVAQRFAIDVFEHDALAHGNLLPFAVDIVVEMLQS